MISDTFENLFIYQKIFRKNFLLVLHPLVCNYIDSFTTGPQSFKFKHKEFKIIGFDYPLKDPSACLIESHFAHVDLQMTVTGCEGIYVYSKSPATIPLSKNEAKDIALYSEDDLVLHSKLYLKERSFAILFPNDLHKPQVITENSTYVQKLVVKIPLSFLNLS